MGENFFGITDPGRMRTNNEDSFIAQPVLKKQALIACVIDGVGGYAGGELAAEITRNAIIQRMDKMPAAITESMVAAFEYANEKIFKEKETNKDYDQMACVVTLAIVDIPNNKFYYAHIGDTRLYLFRDHSLVKITNDHSAVGFLEESGRLTEAAAMAHPKRNEVNKALGYETKVGLTKDFIDTGESPFLPGDMILLCSDGLTDMVATADIISILDTKNTIAKKATQLIAAANEAGGRDNVTVVLVRNDKPPLKQAATKPLISAKKIDTEQLTAAQSNGAHELQLTNSPSDEKPVKKSAVGWLVFFCLVFLAGFAWYFFKDMQRPTPKMLMPAPAQKERTPGERRLEDSIRDVSLTSTITLSRGTSITITDSIQINRDTLHLVGNGAVLVADTSYKGPAFALTATCKYILLDSLILENFDAGILVTNKGLHLKNVQFKNCRVPVVFQYQLAQNKWVTGKQTASVFDNGDTIKK